MQFNILKTLLKKGRFDKDLPFLPSEINPAFTQSSFDI